MSRHGNHRKTVWAGLDLITFTQRAKASVQRIQKRFCRLLRILYLRVKLCKK